MRYDLTLRISVNKIKNSAVATRIKLPMRSENKYAFKLFEII